MPIIINSKKTVVLTLNIYAKIIIERDQVKKLQTWSKFCDCQLNKKAPAVSGLFILKNIGLILVPIKTWSGSKRLLRNFCFASIRLIASNNELPQNKNPRYCGDVLIIRVENIGFEPITSSLPAKRSSQMS